MPRPAAAAALSDEQLMRRVQADDNRAFELLFDRYRDRAWHVARLLCRCDDRVDRVLQDAFTVAWRERDSWGVLSSGAGLTNCPGSDCTETEAIAHADHQQLGAQLQRSRASSAR